ncbi:hypothetical protein BH09BAC3_BH09BAC3_33670 [soil metagenome]
MIWKSTKYRISLCVVGLLAAGCFQSDYTKLVKRELSRGVRQDSILLGIRFGDTQMDFFGKCFDLNSAGTVREGPGSGSVRFPLVDSLFHKSPTPIRFLFNPTYDDKMQISEMVFEISYDAWSPWNRRLQADSLKLPAVQMLMNWYKGNEFILVEIDDDELLVKLDCNRRIVVYKKDTETIVAKVQDLLNPMFAHTSTEVDKK